MNNIVVDKPGFYVSYNGNPHSDPLCAALNRVLNTIAGTPEANIGRPETALCIRDGKEFGGVKFLILYGDHRKQFKEAADKGGLSACLDYFNTHRDQAAVASEHEPIEAKIAKIRH